MHTMPDGNMAPQKSWWGRNWKWVVPVGCLGPLLACGCFGAIAFFAASSAIKSTGAYMEAVSVALANPEVQETLGSPIETGMMQGSVKTDDTGGTASFTLPLDGPKADGTLRVVASKQGDKWSFEVLQVEVPGRPPIDLTAQGDGGGTQELAPPTPDEAPPMDEGAPPADEGPGEGDSDIDL